MNPAPIRIACPMTAMPCKLCLSATMPSSINGREPIKKRNKYHSESTLSKMLLYPLLLMVVWNVPRTDATNWVCDAYGGWLKDLEGNADQCLQDNLWWKDHCST